MKIKENINYLTSGISWIATAIQTNEYLQIGMLIMSILSTCISIAFTIFKWYNKVKADKKITQEEIENLQDEIESVLRQKGDKEE